MLDWPVRLKLHGSPNTVLLPCIYCTMALPGWFSAPEAVCKCLILLMKRSSNCVCYVAKKMQTKLPKAVHYIGCSLCYSIHDKHLPYINIVLSLSNEVILKRFMAQLYTPYMNVLLHTQCLSLDKGLYLYRATICNTV